MAKKQKVKTTEDNTIQGNDIEIAEGVMAPSVQDLGATIEEAIEDSVNLNEEVEIPAMETVDVSEELTEEEKQQEDVKKLITEAVNEAIKALPKAKPLMDELNLINDQLNLAILKADYEKASICMRQQAEFESILLVFAELKHKLGFLSPDTCAANVIKRIEAEIFGVKE